MTASQVQTARLVLRARRATDAPHVVRLHGDQRVMRYIGRPAPRTTVLERDLPRLLHRDDRVRGPAYWAAEERECGRFVG